jgi:hypothetical protein
MSTARSQGCSSRASAATIRLDGARLLAHRTPALRSGALLLPGCSRPLRTTRLSHGAEAQAAILVTARAGLPTSAIRLWHFLSLRFRFCVPAPPPPNALVQLRAILLTSHTTQRLGNARLLQRSLGARAEQSRSRSPSHPMVNQLARDESCAGPKHNAPCTKNQGTTREPRARVITSPTHASEEQKKSASAGQPSGRSELCRRPSERFSNPESVTTRKRHSARSC